MKKYLSIFLLLTVICGSSAFASPSVDGNLSEWSFLAGAAYEVENDKNSGAGYDIRSLGLFIDNNMMYIALQTDFNLAKNPDGLNISPGDFIFNFGGDNFLKNSMPTVDNAVDNTYEFALDFSINNDKTITFTEYSGSDLKWNSTTDFRNYYNGNNYNNGSYYNDYSNNDGNTVRYDLYGNRTILYDWVGDKEDGAPWQVYNNTVNKPVDNKYTKYNTISDPNELHIIEAAIDLNGLSKDLVNLFDKNNSVTMHWQMECGNDFLEVKANYDYTPVPEPQTFLLFGFGLLALSSAGRYRLNKKA